MLKWQMSVAQNRKEKRKETTSYQAYRTSKGIMPVEPRKLTTRK
jgi:hypothetical protein